MGKEYTEIDARIQRWIEQQHIFFVSTAPLAGDGLINCSPKGLDGFRVLNPGRIGYVDVGGSGIETVAHIKENGRIVLMFCAFEGPPKIVRLYGRGEVIEPAHVDFDSLRDKFPTYASLRCFIRVACERIADSCGWAVPKFDFQEQRSQLIEWAEHQGVEAVTDYQLEKNAASLDGLPGLTSGS